MRVEKPANERNAAAFCTLRFACLLLALASGIAGCRQQNPIIYVIPRTTATLFWESEHSGALQAGRERGYRIYWNAATRDDDVERQIVLLQRAADRKAAGVIVAPTHAAALLTVVRQLLAEPIPVVVVQTRLALPSSDYLLYIVPDHYKSGATLAHYIANTKKEAVVALLGVNPDLRANSEIKRGLADTLAAEQSGQIAAIRYSRFNRQETEEQLEKLLSSPLAIDTVVAMDPASTAGALDALKKTGKSGSVKIIGCDQDITLEKSLELGDISAMLVEDTKREGYLAVQAIAERRRTGRWPSVPEVEAKLITAKDLRNGSARSFFELGPER